MFRDASLPRHGLAAPLPDRSLVPAWKRPVATALAAVVAVVVGVGLGLLVTAATTRSSTIGTVRIGPWRLYADAGSPAPNPYARARMARTAEIPLAAAEGLTIVARHDSAGEALDGRCAYRVSGAIPPARFWTLEAASTGGVPFINPAGRQAFTSADVLRDVAGHVVIALAPTVQPGNWLPLTGAGRFELVLRLYDSGLTGLPSRATTESGLPAITRLACAQ